MSAGIGGDGRLDGIARAGSGQVRDHVMRLLDDRKASRHLGPDAKEKIESLIETHTPDLDGDRLARHIAATSTPEYREAFQAYASGAVQAFSGPQGAAIQEARAMSIGTPTAGGLSVPSLIDPTLILAGQGSPNPFAGVARVETITTDTWRGLSSAGVTWSIDGEGTEVSDDSPAVAQPEVPTYRASGFVPYSIEVGMDWPRFAEDMSLMLSRGYSELVVDKLTVGTGTGPVGIVTSLVATTASRIVLTTSATISTGEIYNMWDALPARARPVTSWMGSTKTENTLRQFGSSDPNFERHIGEGGVSPLFNRPFHSNDYVPDLPSGTNAGGFLVAGDFSGFLVAQRAGMVIESVPHLFGASGRPTGQRGFFAWSRFGSDVVDPSGLRVLVNKTS